MLSNLSIRDLFVGGRTFKGKGVPNRKVVKDCNQARYLNVSITLCGILVRLEVEDEWEASLWLLCPSKLLKLAVSSVWWDRPSESEGDLASFMTASALLLLFSTFTSSRWFRDPKDDMLLELFLRFILSLPWPILVYLSTFLIFSFLV